ncbi:MAG: hypothetical protein ACKPKO_47920, partial [Candidatus Fonsibacter sp.]
GSAGLAGDGGELLAEWSLPDSQRPALQFLLSADRTELMVRAVDEGLNWRLECSTLEPGAIWETVSAKVEAVDNWLIWRLPCPAGESSGFVRVVLE